MAESVNDASTQQLMQHLYRNLAQSTAQAPITRAEALQQAQLSLLHGQTANARNAGRSLVQVRPTSGATRSHPPTSGLSHPYYWAPFILIGNSL
jgi:CHAT domain-containing protein